MSLSTCLKSARLTGIPLALFSLLGFKIDTGLTQAPTVDPVAEALQEQLTPSVAVFLEHHRKYRRYNNARFPITKPDFDGFREDLIDELTSRLGLENWIVRSPNGKMSPIAERFQDRLLEESTIHGITVEIHAVTVEPTGLVVPMVVCLPGKDDNTGSDAVPGVCVFSGHTNHDLRDLVLDLDSYQLGMAIRLAQAGIATIAVEKIDTGYLSRHGTDGNHEFAIATLMLGRENVLRSHQLRACLAAIEILAAHSRVDETRMGAAGVSLGGWLSVQAALLNDRIQAVADFGRKTRTVATDLTMADYTGQRDLCHIIPGLLTVCERNIMPLALAPRPMLAGHGRKDEGSHREHAANFRQLCEQQYAKLGAAENYTYLIHESSDTMPSLEVVSWFRKEFALED